MTAPIDIAAVLADARAALDEMATELLERGAPQSTVTDRVGRIFAVFFEFARIDAAFSDRRRRETLQLAESVWRAHDGGATLGELAERHGLSKSWISRLVQEGRCVTHATEAWSAPPDKLVEVEEEKPR